MQTPLRRACSHSIPGASSVSAELVMLCMSSEDLSTLLDRRLAAIMLFAKWAEYMPCMTPGRSFPFTVWDGKLARFMQLVKWKKYISCSTGWS